MDEKRQGEIALAILKRRMFEKGIMLSSNARKEIEVETRDVDIPPEEIMEFEKILVREIFEKVFAEPAPKKEKEYFPGD